MAKSKVDGIGVTELERLLKQKRFSPLYLFFGEEDFLISEALHTIIDEAVDDTTRSFNLDILYGSDIDAQKIVALASSYPMMADRRVVIVREFDKISNKEPLYPYLEKPAPTTILAFVTSKTDFRQKAFELLKKHAVLVECKIPYDNEVTGWIQARVTKMGKRIKLDASQLLHARTGNSLRVVQSELDKLFVYVAEKKEIGIEDVEEVVGISKQYNIFELQRHIGSLNLPQALEVVERMLDSGESAIGMIVMLTKYFQKLSLYNETMSQRLNEFDLAKRINISPAFVREYATAGKNFSKIEVAECFSHLLEADTALKFSADPKLIMTLLVYKMIRKVKNVKNEAA